MLKRETFINAIQSIQKQAQLTEQINHIYLQMTEGEGILEMGGLIQNALIQTLEDGMEDVYGNISWWLYDAPEDSKVVSWKEDGETVMGSAKMRFGLAVCAALELDPFELVCIQGIDG